MDVTISRVLETLEKLLHEEIDLVEAPLQKFPPYLYGRYDFNAIKLGGTRFVLASPKGNVNLKAIRFDYNTISELSGENCAVYINRLTSRKQDVLIENAIPFVSSDTQFYLPFLGLNFRNRTQSEILTASQISFSTQKLLLIAIYEHWKVKKITYIPETLSVSRMSAKRCFDEIETLLPELIDRHKRDRYFVFEGSKHELYNLVKPHLRTPVKRSFSIQDIGYKYFLSGETALAKYSMLEAPRIPICAVTPAQAREITAKNEIHDYDDSLAWTKIQVMGYLLECGKRKVIDPISVILSLKNEDFDDPRIMSAIRNIERMYL
jgi:hypothetical protein